MLPICKKIVILVLFVVLLGGCTTTAQMDVPEDIREVLDVTNASNRSSWSGLLAREAFSLGAYQITDVDRNWDSTFERSGSGFGIRYTSGKTDGGYSYKFDTAKGPMSGQCLTESKERRYEVGDFGYLNYVGKLECACQQAETRVSLVTIQTNEDELGYSGSLRANGQRYNVESINGSIRGINIGAQGFRVDGNQPVGAVEILHPGRIWLARTLNPSERSNLACAFVGLMLYSPDRD